MSIIGMTNLPRKAADMEIRVVVDGSEIKIVAARQGAGENDWAGITSTHVGDHMLERPQDLRRMIGRDIAAAIQYARDIGYAQAQADIRAALGVKDR